MHSSKQPRKHRQIDKNAKINKQQPNEWWLVGVYVVGVGAFGFMAAVNMYNTHKW